ncbi:hypothetical protein [Rheinheimera soli]|uniref:FlaA1/EpsC-like NDP-sugar epimerase n=1 Tax=Rheinheimera soli TaxID=443616 RepID=A0ABU1VU16_9GAMM|nr:hypothetical protein [Rheinheimera soli]MDR7119214.1 FlaA1/EpsC-like NDP-sugar epimerase [Rheinheimera soli]
MAVEPDMGLFAACPQLSKLLNALAQIRQGKDAQSLAKGALSADYANQRILIFGTGEAGKRFYQMFHQHYQVLAFIDNDQNKQGTTLNNLPVLSPADIGAMSYDVIYIASQYYRAIYQQLVLELAVPAFKVKY